MKLISEDKLHQQCYMWFHNSFPELRGLLCYNLNNSKNAIDGARNRSFGLIAGRSDLVLYHHGTALHLELKIPGGRQSTGQKEWQKVIESHGFKYLVIWDLEQFKTSVQDFLQAS